MSDRDVADDEPLSEQTERPHAVPGFGPPPPGNALVPLSAAEPTPPRNAVRNVVVVLGGVALAAIVIVVLIIWLFMAVIRDAVDDVESHRNESAITAAQYQAVKLGTAEQDLREDLGAPDDVSTSDAPDADDVATCLYYNEKDAGLVAGDRFKFCFTGGQLVRKSRD